MYLFFSSTMPQDTDRKPICNSRHLGASLPQKNRCCKGNRSCINATYLFAIFIFGFFPFFHACNATSQASIQRRQWRSQPDNWSCKCKFLCVYRPYKESISKERNNDNDLNLHLHDQMSGWLRY